MPGLMTPTRAQMEQPEEMWKVEDVATLLNCSVTTIYRMARKGDLPAYWINGMWRFKEEEIREWVAKHRNSYAFDDERVEDLFVEEVARWLGSEVEEDGFYTTAELALRWGISEEAIRRMVAERRLWAHQLLEEKGQYQFRKQYIHVYEQRHIVLPGCD